MNKILLLDDQIDRLELDDNIKCELINKNESFEVNTLKITVLKSTQLFIYSHIINEAKLNVEINLVENVICNLSEYRCGSNCKIKHHYVLNTNSILNLYKFYDIDTIKEFIKIDLNGMNATINYCFKTISNNNEKYDLTIYHNALKTNSNIINNGVNINDGNLIFNVSSFVLSGNIKCNAIQNSRIINLTDNKCQICPNLYIDEYDITASHSAHIGSFADKEIFYLMSRGINKEEAVYLLIKGFLLNNMDSLSEQIIKVIQKYWR